MKFDPFVKGPPNCLDAIKTESKYDLMLWFSNQLKSLLFVGTKKTTEEDMVSRPSTSHSNVNSVPMMVDDISMAGSNPGGLADDNIEENDSLEVQGK